MVEVLDHTRLIHPVRTTSELAERAIGKEFVKIDMSEWRPKWVARILKEISADKYYGLVIPEIRFAAFYTNNILRAAGAYHELRGHINALMTNAVSLNTCLLYHLSLVDFFGNEKRAYINSTDAMIASLVESYTQELIADATEISVLRPYTEHEYYGKRIIERIAYLENLGKEEDWQCDMCAGPLCKHRAAMYIFDVLWKDAKLSTSLVADLAYGFCSSVRTHPNERVYAKCITPITPDTILVEMVRHRNQLQDCRQEDMFSLICEIMSESNVLNERKQYGFGLAFTSGKLFSINSQRLLFDEMVEENAKEARVTGERMIETILTKPLYDLIAHSFVVGTDKNILLFVSKEAVPDEENIRMLSLDALVNIKSLAIETYGSISHSVHSNCWSCPSRSGSQCLFRERLGRPPVQYGRTDTDIFDQLLIDRKTVSLVETLKESLNKLSKAKSKSSQPKSLEE